MPYIVDWVAKEINIPTSDLTLVSGTEYNLSMQDFLDEIRRLEWEFSEGLWAPAILEHTNSKPDFAGASYAGFDDIINSYHVHITGVATRVNLLGSNNNLVDVLIVSGVSVVPSNSAGLQRISTGSSVTEQDKIDIIDGVWNKATADLITNGTIGKFVTKLLSVAKFLGLK